MRRLGGVLAGVMLAAGSLVAVGVAPAGADPTTLFNSGVPGQVDGGLTIPAGICSVRVVAVGGGGGSAGSGGTGGGGAQVTTTLVVTPCLLYTSPSPRDRS